MTSFVSSAVMTSWVDNSVRNMSSGVWQRREVLGCAEFRAVHLCRCGAAQETVETSRFFGFVRSIGPSKIGEIDDMGCTSRSISRQPSVGFRREAACFDNNPPAVASAKTKMSDRTFLAIELECSKQVNAVSVNRSGRYFLAN